MKRALVAVLLVLPSVGCSDSKPVGSGETGATGRHLLELRNYDGLSDPADQAVYFFDGKEIGSGYRGIRELRKLDLKPGTMVTVRFPWKRGPQSPPYLPPRRFVDLTARWRRWGIRVEYRTDLMEGARRWMAPVEAQPRATPAPPGT